MTSSMEKCPAVPQASRAPSTLVIQATRGWGALGLRDLWEYRDLLWFHVWRNVKGKYRQMALGPLWIILTPLINMVVFSVVFGRLARLPSEGVPYPIFTYTALVPWTFFGSACQQSVGSLVAQMQVISKVYFPRMIMPISATITAFIDFLVSFAVLVLMMLLVGFRPTLGVVFLPLFVLLAAAAGLGVGLWTASLTVRFRDVRFLVASGVRVAMYLTPVAYSATLISERFPQWMWLYKANPMYWVIEGFRWGLLGVGNRPEPFMLIPVGLVLLLLVSGAYVFRRTERTIVDLL